MADLDALRPEVRGALERMIVLCSAANKTGKWMRADCDTVIIAELLRLQSTESRANEWQLRAERAEAELAAARETIKRLNRRVQVAEAGIAEKVKASAPGSLGRALANAAADKYMRERDMAQAELAALKARIAEAPVATLVISSAAGDLTLVWAENPDDWASKRVRLLVDEPPAERREG